MNRIVEKEYFSANVVKIVIEAPLIAKARKRTLRDCTCR